MRQAHINRRFGDEWRVPRQTLEQQGSEHVNIRPRICGFPQNLLGAHVQRSPKSESRGLRFGGLPDHAGNPKVENFAEAIVPDLVLNMNIVRFDIPMDDSLIVSFRQASARDRPM